MDLILLSKEIRVFFNTPTCNYILNKKPHKTYKKTWANLTLNLPTFFMTFETKKMNVHYLIKLIKYIKP